MRSHIKAHTHSPTYLISTINPSIPDMIAHSAGSYTPTQPLIPARFFRGSLIRKQLGFIHSTRDHLVEDVPSTRAKGGKPKSDILSVYQLSSLHVDIVETVSWTQKIPTKERISTLG